MPPILERFFRWLLNPNTITCLLAVGLCAVAFWYFEFYAL